MAKNTKTLAEKVISACTSNKTKAAIAEKVGASYSAVSAAVNALVAEGVLIASAGKKPATGRPPLVYKRVS